MERNIQSIPLNSIKLDQENVRFGGDIAQSQREAIELMMADKDDIKKLVHLANHIATHGLDPTELQLVIPNNDGVSYIVIEGNRRLTALKMLQNPLLCPIEKYVKSFREASIKLNGSLPTEISCSIVENREAGEIWVELKHTGQNGGAGRVNWDSDIRDAMRTRGTGVDSIGRQIRTLISDNQQFFNDTTIDGIKKIDVTTLTRLFSSLPAQNAFQLKIESKTLTPHFPLEFISPSVDFAVSMFINEGYNVNDIRNDKDRRSFINHIPPELLPHKLAKEIPPSPKPTPVPPKTDKTSSESSDAAESANRPNEDNKETPAKQTETKPKPNDTPKPRAQRTTKARKYLFPWSLKVTSSRINNIYRELKNDLLVDKTPNAAAIVFRVFLETSCDDYIKRFEKTDEMVLKVDNKKPALEGDPLSKKVVAISKHLLDRNKLDKQADRSIAKRASTQENVGSVDHLNMFVHSSASSPIASELKDIAEGYKPLLEAIWS
ncbi:hypothetical protein AB4480_18595 [Vibrio sp. 10N.261.45.A4]|uniref:hypothetical protein n=1 Tax=Vibrio sp. 10N.261.45.A4 TaxID=3229655 RepID=UPI0035519D88